MNVVAVKRNNMGILWTVVIVVLLAIILLPTKTVTYETTEDVVVTQEVMKEVPVEVTQTQNVTKEVVQNVVEEKELSYSIEPFENIDSILRMGNRYAEQDFKVELEDFADGCYTYEYDFIQNDNVARTEQDEVCFSASRVSIIELEERFEGDIEDFSYEVRMIELPVANVTVSKNVTYIMANNTSDVMYVNKTVRENVTSTEVVEKTKKVNWLFGFQIF